MNKLILISLFISFGCSSIPEKVELEKFWNKEIDSLPARNNYTGSYQINPNSSHCYLPTGETLEIEHCINAENLGQRIYNIQLSETWKQVITLNDAEINFPSHFPCNGLSSTIHNFPERDQHKACVELIENKIEIKNALIAYQEQLKPFSKFVPKLKELINEMLKRNNLKKNDIKLKFELSQRVSEYNVKTAKQDKEYKEEQEKFLKEEDRFTNEKYKDYGLTQDEFRLEVVRSDGVADWGLDLGTTVFRISQSRSMTMKDHSIIKENGLKKLKITMTANNKATDVVFIFTIKGSYAILTSAQSTKDNATLTGMKALALLSIVVY